ncbi:MAG TPA: DUF1097 domain-containing protein [Actinomycetota bacterium]|jgi:hypothetical protein|nr:DUF1097 domain-containing protein [Actinomycetota bacterium]
MTDTNVSGDSGLVLKETIPLWLAVGITVLVALPFTLWLGPFNMATWVSFIVWASYFALGAKPAAAKTIIPAFGYGAALTGVILACIPLFGFLPSLVTPGDLAVAVPLFIGVCFLVYSMKWATVFQTGSLPLFNGLSMVLAVYFTGSYPQVVAGPLEPLFAAAWTFLLALFGVGLGIFNIWLTFPKQVQAENS